MTKHTDDAYTRARRRAKDLSQEENRMFDGIPLHASIPASDYERAKTWYQEKIGLRPVEEDPQGRGAWYETGGVRFLLYRSAFAGTNQATAATFIVEDFDATFDFLKSRGVTFEKYDPFEDIKSEDGVMTLPDGSKASFFKDSEGNILEIAA